MGFAAPLPAALALAGGLPEHARVVDGLYLACAARLARRARRRALRAHRSSRRATRNPLRRSAAHRRDALAPAAAGTRDIDTGRELAVAARSGHQIEEQQPALVARAITDVVKEVRSK